MKHSESSIKIFYTKDYDSFSLINGNRQLNKQKIRRIENDILKGLDVLRYCPILVKEVNNKLEIIDGQHRFAVAKGLKSKVWYIVVEDISLFDIAKINSNTEKWNTNDYINCYAKQKNTNYIELKEFLDKTKYPLSVSLKLLSTGKVGSDAGVANKQAEEFKRGLFKIQFRQQAYRMFEATELFEGFQSRNSRHFIIAIDILIKANKCDLMELVEKYKDGNIKLQKKDSVKEYLVNLEEIYNHRMRQRRVIY